MKLTRGRREPRPRFPVAGDVAALIALALAVLVAAWGERPAPPVPGPQSLPPVVAAEPPEPELRASAGCPEGCETQHSGCVIKGNVSLRTGERIYHVPGGDYYDKTEISSEKGERWFCMEEEAAKNGWRKSKR
ncbi:MAG TPA: hypothetical protein VKK31_13510 [Thermoanaerobaculia bacterium]|nr:hypothetical protein [Thermoanaerobaculia bacterium]